MLAYVIVGPDEEAVERVKQHPLVRLLCILMPSDDFVKLGIDPPLGSAGSGFHDFLPTRVGREEALALAEAIPPRTLDYYAFCGTVDQVVEEFAARSTSRGCATRSSGTSRPSATPRWRASRSRR